MHVIVTGATGFLGSHLVAALRKDPGTNVRTVGRGPGSDLSYQDVLDGGLEDASSIVHLAGLAHDVRGHADDAEYDAVNFGLTRNLYDVFASGAAKTFIFVSSVKALADRPRHPVSETDEPDPQTPYGVSKLKAETYLREHPVTADKSVFVLRPAMVHGPGVKGNLRLLYQLVSRGIPYPLGAYTNQRSLLSIENFCFTVVQALTGALPAGDYNVADDDPLSSAQIVQELAAALRRRPRIWNVPPPFVEVAARLGDRAPLPLDSQKLEKLTEDFVVSNAKLRQALGRSLPMDARSGLRATAKALAEEH